MIFFLLHKIDNIFFKCKAFLLCTCLFLSVLFSLSISANCLAQNQNEQADFTFETMLQPEDPALLRLKRGDRAMREHLYENAIENFKEYRKYVGDRQPDLSRALGKLAEAYFASGELQEAKKILQEEKIKRKELPELMQGWLLYLEAKIMLQEKLWKDCLQLLDEPAKKIDYGPYTEAVLLIRLDCMAELSLWQKSVDEIEAFLQQNPDADKFSLRSRLIKAYLASGNTDKALQNIENISGKITPADEFEFKQLQILAFTAAKQFPSAYKQFQEIKSRVPTEVDADWWRLSWILAELAFAEEKFTEAEEIHRIALSLAADQDSRVKSSIRVADCLIRQGKDEQAKYSLQEFRHNFADRIEYIQVTLRLAELMSATKSNLKAAELFTELAEHPKTEASLRCKAAIQAADCLERDGQFPDAIAAYRKAAAICAGTAQKAAEALANAAKIAASTQDYTLAATIFQELAEKYPATELGKRARFEQASNLYKATKYEEAVKIFLLFTEEHSEHKLFWKAKLFAGIAGRLLSTDKKEFLEAAASLLETARNCGNEELAMEAYFEAFQAQMSATAFSEAVELLQEADKLLPKSSNNHLIKYHLCSLLFRLGREDEAIKNTKEFMEKYSTWSTAGNLCLLAGDYFASKADYQQAREYYSLLQDGSHDSSLIAIGIYEDARCAFLLDELQEATELLNKLLEKSENTYKIDAILLAKAEYLLGDILTKQGKYEEARKYFALARNDARDSELGFAALGRQAEMLMDLAEENPQSWDKAIECLQEILKPDNAASEELKEMARYRLAKCMLGKGNNQEAILIFQDIYLNYVTDRDQGKVRSWRYYYLSVFELTALLERKGDTESLRRAARLYEDLANSGLPRSKEAALKAKKIREKHKLGEGSLEK